jgi:hypothetical protein
LSQRSKSRLNFYPVVLSKEKKLRLRTGTKAEFSGISLGINSHILNQFRKFTVNPCDKDLGHASNNLIPRSNSPVFLCPGSPGDLLRDSYEKFKRISVEIKTPISWRSP